MFETVISREEAARHINDDDWLFIDCRFVMREPESAEREYLHSRIRGALFAQLERDLSAPAIQGRTGRHPLPEPGKLVDTFSRWGIDARTQVVAYDESTGAMAAARLWWLLKWAGHDAVGVLDGGFRHWVAAGLPCDGESPSGARASRPRRAFAPRFRPEMAVDAAQVLAVLEDPAFIVMDARAAERYHGENETMDPVAGHIRGAVSAPHLDNLLPDSTFRPPAELDARLAALCGGRDAAHVVMYCGSGVTAAHEVLAFARAGRGMPRLYPGSWSEWITDPGRPVAT